MRQRWIAILAWSVIVGLAAARAEEARPEGLKPLEHYVGAWNLAFTHKPTPSLPDGAKSTAQESIGWALKERFILIRGVEQPDGVKTLWLITHDPNQQYLMWGFLSNGVLGAEISGAWDEASKTLTWKLANLPAGWTTQATNQFPDKNTGIGTSWMKNDAGTLAFDQEWKKTRISADAGEKILVEWAKPATPEAPQSAESKVLERLVGSWDTTDVLKVAEWTPAEVRKTSKVTRKWVLNGRLLQDTSVGSDGAESISLFAYDPQMKAYRSWWFSSEGWTNKGTGKWDDATQTLSFKLELEKGLGEGLVAEGSMHFIDKDRHVWKSNVKDGAGKLYFDGEWTVTRRKE